MVELEFTGDDGPEVELGGVVTGPSESGMTVGPFGVSSGFDDVDVEADDGSEKEEVDDDDCPGVLGGILDDSDELVVDGVCGDDGECGSEGEREEDDDGGGSAGGEGGLIAFA